ncbi:MAG: hypothetical protein ACERKX_02570 [Anaerolineales bacterium]
MKTGRILIVDADFDISNLLRIFFDGEGYDLDELPQLLTSLDGGAFKMDGESGNASPELSLSIGVLRVDEQNFENIFQVTKSSANARQLDG